MSTDNKIINYYIIEDEIKIYLENGKSYNIPYTKENEDKVNDAINKNINLEDVNKKLKKEKMNINERSNSITKSASLSIKVSSFALAWQIAYPDSTFLKVISYIFLTACSTILLSEVILYKLDQRAIEKLEKYKLFLENEQLINDNIKTLALNKSNNPEVITLTTVRKMKYQELKNMIEKINLYRQYNFDDYDDINKTYSEREIEELSKKYDNKKDIELLATTLNELKEHKSNDETNKVRTLN